MIEKKQKRIKIVIGIAIILACLVIIYSGLSDFAQHYRTVEEVTSDLEYYSTYEVNMVGRIVNGSFQQVGTLSYTFQLTDDNATVDVKYDAALPQTFDREGTIVVTGSMNGTIFESGQMHVKCPTKYEPETERLQVDDKGNADE